jgi:hypothetical protein
MLRDIMRNEAADAGGFVFKLWHDKDYPKIQILPSNAFLTAPTASTLRTQLNPFAVAARKLTVHKQSELL